MPPSSSTSRTSRHARSYRSSPSAYMQAAPAACAWAGKSQHRYKARYSTDLYFPLQGVSTRLYLLFLCVRKLFVWLKYLETCSSTIQALTYYERAHYFSPVFSPFGAIKKPADKHKYRYRRFMWLLMELGCWVLLMNGCLQICRGLKSRGRKRLHLQNKGE